MPKTIEARETLLWLDDVRPAPPGWVWAKTVEEAKEVVLNYLAQYDDVLPECSLDHDLGATPEQVAEHGLLARGGVGPTGMDFVRWLVDEGQVPRKVTIHSFNPIAAADMAAALYVSMKEHSDLDPDFQYALTVEPYSQSMFERQTVETVIHRG